MSKMSQLSAQLDELIRCGEAMIRVGESLKELFSGDEASVPEMSTEKPAAEKSKGKAKKEAEPVNAEPVLEKKAVTLEEVRTLLAEKSRAGLTEQVKEIIEKHGAKKLSEIDPAEYEALIAEVEVL